MVTEAEQAVYWWTLEGRPTPSQSVCIALLVQLRCERGHLTIMLLR